MQKLKDEEGEGCNVHGFLEVNKVAGNFHFVPGQSFHQSGFQFGDLIFFQQGNYNVKRSSLLVSASLIYIAHVWFDSVVSLHRLATRLTGWPLETFSPV